MNSFIAALPEVVIRHTCTCEGALEHPAHGAPHEHVFTVNGEDFPWYISERGQRVTRLADDLYSVDVEIMLLDKQLTDGHHAVLPFGYPTYGIPYVPLIGGQEFPWPLTEDGCQLNFGHKVVPTLHLAFLARSVDTNAGVDDRRRVMSGQDIYRNGGDLIRAGDES